MLYFNRLLGALACLATLNKAALAVPASYGHFHSFHSKHFPFTHAGSERPTASSSASVSTTPTPSATPLATTPASSASASSAASVLIPLYWHPINEAWAPVYEVISSNPNVQFTVIVNPSSGPTSAALPDEYFLAEIPKLNQYSNVRTIGYVSTKYGQRAQAEVENDVALYAGWPAASGNSNFAVHGIFFDEEVSEYDESVVTYYQEITKYAKAQSGLGGSDTYVVTNPGTIPDAAYLEIPDSTVVVETTYADFKGLLEQSKYSSLSVDTSRLASIVHSVPSGTNLAQVVSEAVNISGSIYVINSNSYSAYDAAVSEVAQDVAA